MALFKIVEQKGRVIKEEKQSFRSSSKSKENLVNFKDSIKRFQSDSSHVKMLLLSCPSIQMLV